MAIKKAKLFFLNAGLLAGVNILLRLISVSFNAYVSKKIGAEGMGLFSLVMSVYGLAVTVAASGVHLAAVRLTAAALERGEHRRGIMGACLLYAGLFGGFSAVTLFAFSSPIATVLLGDIRTLPSLRALSLGLPFISLSTALSGYFTGVRRVYKNVIVSLVEQFVKITLTAAGLMLFAPAGLTHACLAVVGGAAVSEAFSLVISLALYIIDKGRKSGKLPTVAPFQKVFSTAFPVAVGSYARQGLLTAEHLAIPWGLRKSGASAGDALASYGVLQGMVFPLVLFPSAVLGAFSGLLVPEFAEAKERGENEKICRMTKKVIRTSLLFSLGVAGVFLSFSFELGHAFYPGTDAGRQLSLIAPLIPVMYLDSSVDAMLKGLGEQLHCMKINILDSGVSLCLVLFLLPRLGLSGYFIVLYVCEILNAALSISRLLAATGLTVSVTRFVAKPVLSIILATSLVRLFSAYSTVPLIGSGAFFAWRITVVGLLYLLFIRLFGAVDREDLAFLKRVFVK